MTAAASMPSATTITKGADAIWATGAAAGRAGVGGHHGTEDHEPQDD